MSEVFHVRMPYTARTQPVRVCNTIEDAMRIVDDLQRDFCGREEIVVYKYNIGWYPPVPTIVYAYAPPAAEPRVS